MPVERPDGDERTQLDEHVKDALVDALAGSQASPALRAPGPSRGAIPGDRAPLRKPVTTAAHDGDPGVELRTPDRSASRPLPGDPDVPLDPLRLLSLPGRAISGEQSAIETLGRGFSRRDPVDGLDPLPRGRDSAAFSTAAIAGGREAGQHWPDLIAFRLSDDFPAEPFDPLRVAERAGRNLLPALMFPEPMPGSLAPKLPRGAPPVAGEVPQFMSADPAQMMPKPTLGPGAAGLAPAWLASAPSSPRTENPSSASLLPGDELPPWLNAGLARERGRASSAPKPGIRRDFPALDQEVHGRPLVWLDNAATTQKPRAVIEAVSRFYERDNSNVHRGAHELAARATDAYEGARAKVQRFLGAHSSKEIVFVRGTTEAINLVAQSWGRAHIRSGDEILVTHLEHHSNIVPWQLLCEATGATLRVVPVDDAGDVRLDAYEAMLGPRVKLVAFTQVSNALGTLVPAALMVQMAHQHGARVLVDGAQSVSHLPVDMTCLGADFFVFSGHKIYGPTGIGVLYGREDVLAEMPPWQGGGNMIEDVTFERTTYAPPPARFEAGTPSLADAVGLGIALDYVERVGRPVIAAHEQILMSHLVAGLSSVPGLSIVGAPTVRVGAVSFVLAGHEPQAIGQYLNRRGIAVRAGHHCAQPILRRFGHETTVRPSLGIYNDESDIARLVRALRDLHEDRGR
jgi:cysteine desulfurase / selenocysteine lyase